MLGILDRIKFKMFRTSTVLNPNEETLIPCAHNVGFRRVCEAILCKKSGKYYIIWVFVCSLSYPAFIGNAPYKTVLCGISGFTVFFTHYPTGGTIYGKSFIQHKMCVLISAKTLGWSIYFSFEEKFGEMS